MGKSAARAEMSAPLKEPIRKAPEDAFARAVEIIGGERALSNRSSMPVESIHEILWSGTLLDPDFCPEIERAVRLKVTCEELRPDLIWHRDGAGEVIGYTAAMEGQPRAALAALLAPSNGSGGLVDGKWDPLSYRAGILHGVDQSYVDELLNGVYGGDRDWTDHNTLDGLHADVDDWHSTGAYFEAYGMLYDLDEKTREHLMAESGIGLSREWSQEKADALWAKAQAIRAREPFKSSAATHAYLAGMAAVVNVHGDGADFIDFFTGEGGCISLVDAEDLTRAADYALGLILDAALKPAKESPAAWFNVVAATDPVHRHVGSQTAERIGRAAANLLDLMLPGLEAIHDYQFVVMAKSAEDCLDSASPINLCAFQMTMQQLTQQLVILRENMLARKKELEA